MANAAVNNGMQMMQHQDAPVCHPAFIMQNNLNNDKTDKIPFCIFENQNYCWTRGHHIEDDHTSATCRIPKPGHQIVTNKMNTMGDLITKHPLSPSIATAKRHMTRTRKGLCSTKNIMRDIIDARSQVDDMAPSKHTYTAIDVDDKMFCFDYNGPRWQREHRIHLPPGTIPH